MANRTITAPTTLRVGGQSRAELTQALRATGIQLNALANTLLDDPVFDDSAADVVTVVERSVDEFGLVDGAVLSDIFTAAQESGLRLCPPTTGPYLRLALRDQPSAADSILSNGRAPTDSLTVASAPLHSDDGYPKGFYVRVIDGLPWLRGYRCSQDHIWDPADRFVFSAVTRSKLFCARQTSRAVILQRAARQLDHVMPPLRGNMTPLRARSYAEPLAYTCATRLLVPPWHRVAMSDSGSRCETVANFPRHRWPMLTASRRS